MTDFDHDFVIIGSGFGGSPCGLRLVEKGYDVLMLERGSELGPADFPATNWNLKRWMWLPSLGWRGIFRLSFFRHVTVLSGVGVGGGSLGYACTHPVPARSFFQSPSWATLADWETELADHYRTVKRMLGVTPTPFTTEADEMLREIAEEDGNPAAFSTTDVAIYFGRPGESVVDPYFSGEGPPRAGCIRCGGCMLGCRYGAKNSLDKNYLWLARKRGMRLEADTDVTAIRPLSGGGFRVEAVQGRSRWGRQKIVVTSKNVIVAGGVLGTLKLLFRMKHDPNGLPRLSHRLGESVRTNSEALMYVVSPRSKTDQSKGIAIGSIYKADAHSHLEPVRYSAGSGFFRILLTPHVAGANQFTRALRIITALIRHPLRWLRAYFVSDLAKRSTILLYMRAIEGSLRLVAKPGGRLRSETSSGPSPTALIPEATALARRIEQKVDGATMSSLTETLFDIPTTAHILGGCCMGESADSGVIDAQHRVFGYRGLYVVDGSSVSANPGVNPSLTIAALAERAMSFIPPKSEAIADDNRETVDVPR